MSSTAGSQHSSKAEALEQRLLEAHAVEDGVLLSTLYAEAANLAEEEGETDRACFFLTHAFIFALEAGLPAARDFEQRLQEYGRA